MRVLWYSNCPWCPTGYGNQTAMAVVSLAEAGHEVAVLANYGLNGQPLDMGGILVFPAGKGAYSNDVVEGTAKDFKADVLVTLYDAWPLNFYKNESFDTPWVAWAPVDHETMPPPTLEALKHADLPVAYSKHGLHTMLAEGLDAAYIPHGIDTNIFKPLEGAKERVGFDPEAFVFGVIAANVGYPSRKSIPDIMLAYSLFRQARPDLKSVLYMHMLTSQEKAGVNVWEIAKSLGIGEHVVTCDQWHYNKSYPTGHMVDLYNSFDVLLNPSMGEGFGIPIMEAISCGVPAIGSDITSMPELIGENGERGLLVETRPWWSQQGAWQGLPEIDDLVHKMIKISDMGKERFRGACRDFAVEHYDFATVVGPLWDKLIQEEQWKKEHTL